MKRLPAVLALGLLLLGAPSAASETTAVVGHVAGLPVTVGDLRDALPPAPVDRAALTRALDRVIDERLLAAEARSQLGERARGLSPAEAARLLEAVLFDPGEQCAMIPEPVRRQHYAETVWRFVAPPAWRVQDLQLLCCKNPRACDTPEVSACLDATADAAAAVRAELPDEADEAAFREAFERLRASHAELYLKTYTFYYDPQHPLGRIHGRLQTVDGPIARAGSALRPGQVSPTVRTRFGHHVLRLDHVRPEVALPWDDPRTQALLRTELCPGHLVELRRQLLSDLRAHAPIAFDQAALRAAFPEL